MMNLQLELVDPAAQVDAVQAAQKLGNLLAETPEYKQYIAALKAVNTDLTIQKISMDMRAHRSALRWDPDGEGKHAAELTRLELVLADQPVMQDYQKAEAEIRVLFQEVDKIISQEAGVGFAANALRRGCACSV
jgi:cell fate (sporulation/competence/biofilm development) regulator YlbF (YheA/YmcA/DUF963 family)